MDKQKLEEARLLAMSMTSHPVAFGTIDYTEKAGELLGLLWQEVLRLQCDLNDARDQAGKQAEQEVVLRELTLKTGELIEHLQKTGRLKPCFYMPALADARNALAN